MKNILENLALIQLDIYGKNHGIDISGTHLIKIGRGFKYGLCSNTTGETILTVSFQKHAVPTYSHNPAYIKA